MIWEMAAVSTHVSETEVVNLSIWQSYFKKSRRKRYNNVQQNHTSYFKTSRQKKVQQVFLPQKSMPVSSTKPQISKHIHPRLRTSSTKRVGQREPRSNQGPKPHCKSMHATLQRWMVVFCFFCSEGLSYQLGGYLRNHVYILGPANFHCSSG